MNTSQPAASHELNQQLTAVTGVTVAAKDTVGALDPSMPQVAATPYLVTVAEFACANLIKHLLEPARSRSALALSSIIWARARSAPSSW